jgi:hypothetical protein
MIEIIFKIEIKKMIIEITSIKIIEIFKDKMIHLIKIRVIHQFNRQMIEIINQILIKKIYFFRQILILWMGKILIIDLF